MVNVAAQVFTEAPLANTTGNNVPIVPVKVVFIADRKVGSTFATPCKPFPHPNGLNSVRPTVH